MKLPGDLCAPDFLETLLANQNRDGIELRHQLERRCLQFNHTFTLYHSQRQSIRFGTEIAAGNSIRPPEYNDEIGIIHNDIESVCGPIFGLAVTGRVKNRGLVSGPVVVVGKFKGSHLSVNVHAAASEAVTGIVADYFIQRVRNVETADVAVTCPAEIKSVYIMVFQGADWSGPGQIAIFVIMPLTVIDFTKARRDGRMLLT